MLSLECVCAPGIPLHYYSLSAHAWKTQKNVVSELKTKKMVRQTTWWWRNARRRRRRRRCQTKTEHCTFEIRLCTEFPIYDDDYVMHVGADVSQCQRSGKKEYTHWLDGRPSDWQNQFDEGRTNFMDAWYDGMTHPLRRRPKRWEFDDEQIWRWFLEYTKFDLLTQVKRWDKNVKPSHNFWCADGWHTKIIWSDLKQRDLSTHSAPIVIFGLKRKNSSISCRHLLRSHWLHIFAECNFSLAHRWFYKQLILLVNSVKINEIRFGNSYLIV